MAIHPLNLIRLTSQAGRRAAVRLPLLAAALCGICLISCTDDMGREPVPSAQVSFLCTVSPATSAPAAMPQGSVVAMQGGSSPLYLHTLNAATVTRATPVTSMYDSFGVSAYQYTDTWSGESETPNFFYNQTATKQTDDGGYAFTGSTYYWPGAASHMRFFAYAPVDNSNYQLSGETEKGAPTLTVTVPSDVADQEDLLVAASDELKGDNGSAVSLKFSHALTAVRFVCGDDLLSGTVNSITISGVYNTGTYNIYTGEWTVSDTSTADFSQTLDKSVDGTEGTSITTEAQTFMMIPQTLPTDAKLTVSFTDSSNTEHELTANIGNTVWTKGQTVTYKISSSSINWTYTLSVTGPAKTYGCTGGTQQYTVKSYRTHNGKSTTEAVKWTTQYSVDGGATWTASKPTWLTDFTDSGEGGEEGTSYDATLGAQTITASTGNHIYTLQKADAKGTAAVPYNLANQTDGDTTVENTANCYVVNAPGYYSFPLVYGNAIKNSKTNSSAYTSTVTDNDNVLTPFINHLGNGITDPYIANNTGCTPATAELVWQDAENLVTDIQYNAGSSTTDGTISFYVDRATIRQGNAVIAVKDASGTVLWSWHIWVTDETISADNTIAVMNYQETTINFMPVNLGWCDGETVTFGTAERTCQVKFTAGSGSNEQTQTITLTQSYGTVTTYDGSPYYQWGRKDPFLPSAGISTTNKTWYDKDGNSSTDSPATEEWSSGGVECIKSYILYPNVMTSYTLGDKKYHNLWSANNTATVYTDYDDIVVKTVYDPSPVGFSVPIARAFTGFTKDGKTATGSNINEGTKSDSGYSFKVNDDKTIFFPALGVRYGTQGALSYAGQYGRYWSAVSYEGANGGLMGTSLALVLNYNYIYPMFYANRWFGQNVRPAKEQ